MVSQICRGGGGGRKLGGILGLVGKLFPRCRISAPLFHSPCRCTCGCVSVGGGLFVRVLGVLQFCLCPEFSRLFLLMLLYRSYFLDHCLGPLLSGICSEDLD